MNFKFTPFRFSFLLALLIFATFPQVILGLQTFVIRDYGFFVYPLAHFQRDCFWRGEIPFWDPYNNCGVPFLAQWNTMPLYPPALIYLLLPMPWSLSFFALLHLWFAGVGMFFLARRWTGNAFAAAFAGVVFSFNGFTLNLLVWPSHLATISWMPWVILAVEMAWRDGGRKMIFAAFAGAMQMFAGGPEFIFLTWVLLLAFWIQQLISSGRDAATPTLFAEGGASVPASRFAKIFFRFPVIVLLVIALTAAQLFPFLDLAAHSQRSSGYADFRWSMPLRGLANFLVPMAFGNTSNAGVFFQRGQSWTSSYYLGVGTLWLALVAIWMLRERRVRLLGAAAIVSLLFALGGNTFVLPAVRKILPQLSFITYPIKYIAPAIFVAPLLAAFVLARLQNFQNGKKLKFQKRLAFLGIILLALIAVILFCAWRFPFPGDNIRATLLNGLSRAAFLILTGAILFVLAKNSESKAARLAPLILIFVAWLDVLTHEPPQNPTAQPWIYQPGLACAKLALNPQPALGRSRLMLSPAAQMDFIRFASDSPQNNFLAKRIGYCANINLLDDVPKVDGFFSLTPRENDDLESLLYGATNADFPRLEDFMGVSQITAPTNLFQWKARQTFLPLVTAGQKPVFLDDAKTLQALAKNDFDGSKTVFLPPSEKSFVKVSDRTSAKILESKFGNQTVDIEVEAAETSLVVIAQTYYHDWRALVDGQPVPLLRANLAFQAVQISKGKHHVQLIYKDCAFQTGAAISIIGWLGCLSFLFCRRRKIT